MGNIAVPNTPYCLGFQQASLSVGNKTFSTQNPPISYSIDGGTVTVFDALGVIGITSYSSDDFVEISSSPASPNTNYCSSAKAVLSWSSGTVETLNTPISYQLRSNIVEWGNGGVVQGIYNAPTAVNSASIQSNANKLLINGQIETFDKPVASWQNISQSQIQVDWGGGDVVFLNGSTWTVTPLKWLIRFSYSGSTGSNQLWYAVLSQNTPVVENLGFDSVPAGNYSRLSFITTSSSCSMALSTIQSFFQSSGPLNRHKISINGVQSFIYEIAPRTIQYSFPPTITPCPTNLTVTTNTGATSSRANRTSYPSVAAQTSCILRVTFTDNTTQELSYPTCPTVQSVPGCTVAIILANSTAENILVDPCPDFVNVINNEVTVVDSTGQIFKSDYLTPPLNFQVTCYDFNVTEVSYVCQGDCPSGTEFRCVCPATNTIMCYGFDPDNPNVFRPLFTTQITS